MSDKIEPRSLGLDVGTSFIISSEYSGDEIRYKEFRDAFFRMNASTPVANKMLEKGLVGKKYFKDSDGSFIVVGQDAIDKSVERHQSALRPLYRGILSPKEKDARRILKAILTELLGKAPTGAKPKLFYSVPAQPVDQEEDTFDVSYHEMALGNDLKELGYEPHSVNEAEALCYSELEDSDYTGLVSSCGAGMQNFCLMSSGEAILKWSITRSGDWLDRMTAAATGEPDSVVQVEKEAGDLVIGKETPNNRILTVLSAYYIRLIEYSIKHLAARLQNADSLPKFKAPIPFIIAGGTSLAKGYIETFESKLKEQSLPIAIKYVKHAEDPLRSVARGALIAASL